MATETAIKNAVGIITVVGLAAAVWLVSSGRPRQAVGQGAVTYKGQPVKAGIIRFTPVGDGKSPRPMVAGQIKDGRYEVRSGWGSEGGTFRVTISGYSGIPIKRGLVMDPLGTKLFPDVIRSATLPCSDFEHDVNCE